VRRAEENADDMIGQDSFLDVVTNIVGILILLVMVVGMRAGKAAATAVVGPDGRQSQNVSAEQQLQDVYRTALNTERDLHDSVRRAVDSRDEAMLREHERLWLAQAVAEAEQVIAARRAKLSTNDQRDFDIRRDLSDAQLRLDELTREQVALLAEGPEVEEIKCEPTPVARAVSGKEIHVLLANDHIIILPADELIEQMYADFAQNAWRLKNEDEMVRTIGPLNGFRLQYSFEVRDVVVTTRSGVTTSGRKPEFLGLFFLPVSTPIGEPAEHALNVGSEFRQQLATVDPSRTALTVWTYPGNYDRLRELRKVARELGYQTAIRPLPKGCPIGFSPTGSRSVSE
jgi:hypothetical protein